MDTKEQYEKKQLIVPWLMGTIERPANVSCMPMQAAIAHIRGTRYLLMLKNERTE